nr:MAG TPA: hypothetical protein [Crassvirales sp.]
MLISGGGQRGIMPLSPFLKNKLYLYECSDNFNSLGFGFHGFYSFSLE